MPCSLNDSVNTPGQKLNYQLSPDHRYNNRHTGLHVNQRSISSIQVDGGRGGFSLVELLVVVGIIVFLAGLLLGPIAHIRDKAIQASCASNLRQCGMAHFALANDNRGRLLINTYSEPHRSPAGAASLTDYCDNMAVFTCREYNSLNLATIDKELVYTTYCYYPGRSLPVFRAGQVVPARVGQLTGQWVLMSDLFYVAKAFNLFQANHGRSLPPAARYSAAYGSHWGTQAAMTSSSGANSLMNDGRVQWQSVQGLVNYGSSMIPYSLETYASSVQ